MLILKIIETSNKQKQIETMKKKENKTTQFNFRLTENEMKFIKNESKKQKLNLSKFILKSIIPNDKI